MAYTHVSLAFSKPDGTPFVTDVPDLVELDTNQAIEDAAGSFSVRLKDTRRSRAWFHQLGPQMFISVYISRGRKSTTSYDDLVFTGLVDSVRSSTQLDGKYLVIGGRSFGKLLMGIPIYFPANARNAKYSAFARTPEEMLKQGSTIQIIQQLLDQWVFNWWDMPTHWGDFFTVDALPMVMTSPDPEIGSIDAGWNHVAIEPGPIPVWNKLQEFAAPPFGEIYLVQDRLTIRPRPWVPDLWDKLRRHEVTDKDIVTVDVDQNDHEVFNNIWVHATNILTKDSAFPMVGVYPGTFADQGLLDPRDEKVRAYVRYGLRKADFNHPIGHIGSWVREVQGDAMDSKTAGVIDMLNRLAKLYYGWYHRPYKMSDMTIAGRNVLVGERISVASEAEPLLNRNGIIPNPEPGEWYVERVGQKVKVDNEQAQWTTALTLSESRAYPHNDLDGTVPLPVLANPIDELAWAKKTGAS